MQSRSFLQYLVPVFWFAGLVFALMPFKVYEAEFFSAALVLVCLSLGVTLLISPLRVPKAPVLIVAIAFWVLALLSAFLSDVFFVSFIYFCYFSVFPLSVLIVILHPDRSAFFKVAGVACAGFMACIAVSSLGQFYFMPEMLAHGLVRWPLVNPNALAALMSLGFYGALGWMLAAPSRAQSNLALGLAVVVGLALLTTGSRGAILALIFSFVPFFIFVRAHAARHKRCLSVLAAALVLGAGLMHVSAPDRSVSMSKVAVQTVDGSQPLLWERPAIWRGAYGIIKDHLWTGTGIGTFYLYYPEHRGEDYRSAGRSAHSDPLQFAAEMGVLAPVLFYLFILMALWRTAKAMGVVPPEDVRRVHILVPVCALGAMIAHTHISFNFYVLTLLMGAGFYTGYWVRNVYSVDDLSPPVTTFSSRASVLLLAFAALGVMLFGYAGFQGSHILVKNARLDILRGDFDSFAANINGANHLSGGRNPNAYVLASTNLLSMIERPGGRISRAQARDIYAQGMDMLEKARTYNPRLASVLFAKARFIKAGRAFDIPAQDDPLALLIQAERLDPLHIGVRLVLADTYLEKGQQAEALEVLRRGLLWAQHDSKAVPYYKKTIQLARMLGDTEALELAERELGHAAARGLPGDPLGK